jgi:glycosyltransferase involved in cell wall biosynthesis
MRIVQLTDQYLPAIGGTERHVARLAETLAVRGHELVVVTMARPGLPARETQHDGVEVVRIDAPELALLRRFYNTPAHSFHPPLPLPGTTRALARAIDEIAPDVVHGHNWLTYPYLALRNRVPVVHTIHDYGMACPKMTLLRPDRSPCPGPELRTCVSCAKDAYSAPVAAAVSVGLRAARPLHARIDRVLAVSDIVARAHQAMFPQTIETVPTFVQDGLTERFAHAPRPAFAPDGEYLCYVGALSRHKGLPVLLDAYRSLPNPPPLLICGVPKHDTPDLSHPGITVVENLPHNEVMGAWRHATVALVPSLAEAWGQVVAEAMSMSVPVITTSAVGLASELIRADAGIVVEPGNAPALVAAISELLGDPERRRAMGARGCAAAQHLSISSVVTRLEEIFEEVVRENP